MGIELPCAVDSDCPSDQRCTASVCGAGPRAGDGAEGEGSASEGEGSASEGEGEGAVGEGEGEGEGAVGEGEGEGAVGEGEGEGAVGEGEGEGSGGSGTCASPFSLQSGDNVGDTTGAADQVATGCGVDSDVDDVWLLSSPTPVHVHVAITSTTVQHITLRPDRCAKPEPFCLDQAPKDALDFDVAPGNDATVIVFADVAGPYTLTVTLTSSSCGNGAIEIGEECDDGAVVEGDGCSAACLFEVDDNERESNEDGTPSTGASGAINDFGGNAQANAEAFGIITADRSIRGGVGAGGDEDGFAVQNVGAAAVDVNFVVTGPINPCPGIAATDSQMHIVDTAGNDLVAVDDVNGSRCPSATFSLAPAQKVFVVVSQFDDITPIDRYRLFIDFP